MRVALFACLAACYELPGIDAAEVVSVTTSVEVAPADGVTTVDVQVTLSADADVSKAITITTSDGVVNFAATGDAVRTTTVKLPRETSTDSDDTKTVTVPLRVSRPPGSVRVTASIGDVTARATLVLQPIGPAAMFSESSVTALKDDGTSKADVSVFLFGAPPASVSFGTQLVSRVCCTDAADNRPVTCSAPPALRVTSVAELTTGNKVTLTATTEPFSGTEVLLWLVSSVPSVAFGEAQCDMPDGVTSSAVQLVLRPST